MFSITCKLLITIVSLGLTNNILATKMVFKSGDCNYKRDVFSNYTIQIVNSKVNLDMILVRILPTSMKASLSFGFRMSNAKAYQIIFQHNVSNYCAMIKGMRDSLYHRWFITMLKHSNFVTSCPIQRGYYYLHDWTLDESLVPSFLYLGDYRMVISFYYGKYGKNNEEPLLECTVKALLV